MKKEMPIELVVNGSMVEKLVWFAKNRTVGHMELFFPMNPMTQSQWSDFWSLLSK
jgi:hypothetical protein